MKRGLAFLSGFVFGLGLLLSEMTSPDRVMGFLDVSGAWDPALGFVMGGAVLAATPLFQLARRRAKPVLGQCYDQPSAHGLDRRLVLGAAIFGAGWGLSGICPGPAVVDFALAPLAMAGFMVALVAGILLARPFRTPGHARPLGNPHPTAAR